MTGDDNLTERVTADTTPGKLLEGLPHAKALGIRFLEMKADEATLVIPYDSRLVGDPETGVIHGGVVTTLLDTCCGMAVMMSKRRPRSTATLDLRIDYMKPATPGEALFAHAQIYRATRSVGFVRASAYHADPEEPVAMATAAFMLEYGDRKPKPQENRA